MSTRVDVTPSVLRWALARAGIDEDVAAHKHRWLTGQRKPTFKQLEAFANATHVPTAMLLLKEPPRETLPIPDMRTHGGTGVREPSGDLLDTIYLCQRRQDWYREFAINEGATPLEFIGSASLDDDPSGVASHLSRLLDTDSDHSRGRPTDFRHTLVKRIEALGVMVMISGIVGNQTRRPLSVDEFRGFALTDPVAPLIFVNNNDTKTAQNFTLVHELAHLFLGRSALSDADASGGMNHRRGEESWCNAVAAQTLLPAPILRSMWWAQKHYQLSNVDTVAHRFAVSKEMVLHRLHDCGLLDAETHRDLHEQIIAAYDDSTPSAGEAKARRGNYYRTTILRMGDRFTSALISATLEGGTTYGEAFRLIGTRNPDVIRNFAEQLENA